MKFSKLSKILTVALLVSVLAISLIACSTSKDNKDEKQSTDSSISTLMATEPSDADEASKLYNQFMKKENEILSTDKALWEKVFMASNKETPMIEDGTNYGDFLLKTIESEKDQFTDEEYKKLIAGAEQVKEIEGKLTILEQKYPECANAPSNGDSVPADSNGVVSNSSDATSFPSFDGKDLDGNDVKSSELFANSNVTVVNYWFSTCKPCVGELSELEALNKMRNPVI
jgi:type III secretory pathway component EscR